MIKLLNQVMNVCTKAETIKRAPALKIAPSLQNMLKCQSFISKQAQYVFFLWPSDVFTRLQRVLYTAMNDVVNKNSSGFWRNCTRKVRCCLLFRGRHAEEISSPYQPVPYYCFVVLYLIILIIMGPCLIIRDTANDQ